MVILGIFSQVDGIVDQRRRSYSEFQVKTGKLSSRKLNEILESSKLLNASTAATTNTTTSSKNLTSQQIEERKNYCSSLASVMPGFIGSFVRDNSEFCEKMYTKHIQKIQNQTDDGFIKRFFNRIHSSNTSSEVKPKNVSSTSIDMKKNSPSIDMKKNSSSISQKILDVTLKHLLKISSKREESIELDTIKVMNTSDVSTPVKDAIEGHIPIHVDDPILESENLKKSENERILMESVDLQLDNSEELKSEDIPLNSTNLTNNVSGTMTNEAIDETLETLLNLNETHFVDSMDPIEEINTSTMILSDDLDNVTSTLSLNVTEERPFHEIETNNEINITLPTSVDNESTLSLDEITNRTAKKNSLKMFRQLSKDAALKRLSYLMMELHSRFIKVPPHHGHHGHHTGRNLTLSSPNMTTTSQVANKLQRIQKLVEEIDSMESTLSAFKALESLQRYVNRHLNETVV